MKIDALISQRTKTEERLQQIEAQIQDKKKKAEFRLRKILSNSFSRISDQNDRNALLNILIKYISSDSDKKFIESNFKIAERGNAND